MMGNKQAKAMSPKPSRSEERERLERERLERERQARQQRERERLDCLDLAIQI